MHLSRVHLSMALMIYFLFKEIFAVYTGIFYMVDQSEHVGLCEYKEIPLHSGV